MKLDTHWPTAITISSDMVHYPVSSLMLNLLLLQVRPIQLKDFEVARKRVKASVASHDLSIYENWDEQFGCHVWFDLAQSIFGLLSLLYNMLEMN